MGFQSHAARFQRLWSQPAYNAFLCGQCFTERKWQAGLTTLFPEISAKSTVMHESVHISFGQSTQKHNTVPELWVNGTIDICFTVLAYVSVLKSKLD